MRKFYIGNIVYYSPNLTTVPKRYKVHDIYIPYGLIYLEDSSGDRFTFQLADVDQHGKTEQEYEEWRKDYTKDRLGYKLPKLCECGADSTYGKNTAKLHHSFWCPARK